MDMANDTADKRASDFEIAHELVKWAINALCPYGPTIAAHVTAMALGVVASAADVPRLVVTEAAGRAWDIAEARKREGKARGEWPQ